jgi:hypothetical protein
MFAMAHFGNLNANIQQKMGQNVEPFINIVTKVPQ